VAPANPPRSLPVRALLTHAPTLAEQKATLRATSMARRATVAEALGREAAEAITRLFAREIVLPPGAVVAGYWPLAGELDPRPLLLDAAARGLRLAMPRMQGKGLPLAFHHWSEGEPLVPGPFRVMEPEAGAPLAHPDLVLAPLLAFDRRGHRLGYGAGFYDRTLAALRRRHPELVAIGIAFAAQEVAEVPVDEGDEPLDGVLTEVALHRFERAGGTR
jgi:5-formyltetrahydrofolate cyclo-ligase